MVSTQNDILSTKDSIIATKQDFAALEFKLCKKLDGARADMFKWMLIFGVGQMAVTFGLLLFFLKK